MLTRLGVYADRVIEGGWLAAAVFAPLFFNVYSSRVFEPDKITTLRSFVLIMLVAWLVKLGESGWRGWRGATRSDATTRSGKMGAAAGGVVETAGPSWLGFLRVPVVIAVLVYALAYLISTIFTVTPDASILGSYQRGQGTYTQYSYIMLGIMVLANMRTRAQVDRLLNFMLLTSMPVALYGLLQAAHLDPLPWAGDTATRVASTMGNAIFVAAWLIMVVPFTLYRLFIGASGSLAARKTASVEVVEPDVNKARVTRRPRPSSDGADYGWAVVANGMGILLSSLLVFYLALKLMAGLPYPDGRTWWVLPVALVYFFVAVLAVEWVGRRRNDPRQTGVFMPIIGALVFFTAFVAMPLTWEIKSNSSTGNIDLNVGFEGGRPVWIALAFFLLWCLVAAGGYALSRLQRTEGYADSDRGIVRAALNIGYGFLLVVQLICIYLTQSRGPWLGLGAGLVAFMVAMWLIGRSRGVRWMQRLGGAASALVLVLALFVAALNIPGSPLQGLDNLPIVGSGIARLSTLTRTEDGTGKVRTLIWKGATDLILSDPARALIGWGPEAMYVAYNRFYPPELAQVELRNATPDRSHNVEFDQMVTLGVVGLLAYYFLVGTFFFFTIRLLKRATNTRDRLFAIAMLSAVTSHFVEIQTGIQIASTWTYFYLILGMMVAFGYYITGYLRPAEETDIDGQVGAHENGALRQNGETTEDIATTEARPVAAAVAAGSRTSSATATMTANGKPTTAGPALPKSRSKASQPVQQPQRGSGTIGSRGGGQSGDGRRRQPAMQYGGARGSANTQWYRSPLLLVLYGVAAVVALFIVWTVNTASVKADTLFKQAQAYDNAQRYFTQVDQQTRIEYPGSLQFYNEAIQLQPNQDYYYLFLGRAWLEAAKSTDTEQYNIRASKNYDQQDTTKAAQERFDEKLLRLRTSEQILKRANELSPMNTDHYANLGRLYLYWGDASGGRDPSKSPLAVQWMQQATEHTPGNAQLWDELSVAYARNNQFAEAMKALDHSQNDIDPTFGRTPFIKGQLLEERAANVKSLLSSGGTLPTDGETDYGKLMLETGKAYSDTIGLDLTQFVDTQIGTRIDFLLEASQPFSKTNTQLPANVVNNILTDTVQLALKNETVKWEDQIRSYLAGLGVAEAKNASGSVPDIALERLVRDPAWMDPATQTWKDATMQTLGSNAAMASYGLGLTYKSLGRLDDMRAAYNRALLLNPSYQDVKTAMDNGMKDWEGQLAALLKARGVTLPAEGNVPDATLQTLLADPTWVNQSTKTWVDEQVRKITENAAIYHYGLGIGFQRGGQPAQARLEYGRALLLKPGYKDAETALQKVQ
ncbi:MAG: O-antigen ligase family protein [Chloroflexota bacterium]